MARSTAYDKAPHHTLEFDPARVALRVSIGDVVIAESSNALRLREAKYPPVLYVPRDDVRMQHLSRNADSTHCPFKGDAAYFDFDATRGGERIPKVAWSYEDPFDQMQALREHLAFYSDRVRIELVES